MSNICAICDSKTSFFQNRRKLSNDDVVCDKCFRRASSLSAKQMTFTKNVTLEEVKQSIIDSNKNGEYLLNFKSTQDIGDAVKFDDKNKRFLILDYDEFHIINYSDVASFELIKNGDVITRSGLGRAIAGGVLFGGAGAVVGAVTGKGKEKDYCNSLKIKINTKNPDHSSYYINFLNKRVKERSSEYSIAYSESQLTLTLLQRNCDIQEEITDTATTSITDEILRYKNLLDAGAITEDEYNNKKKQLLDL